MSLSLVERVASLFRKQLPQGNEVRKSEIINPADSILGLRQRQGEQTIIQPLKIKIESETPPIVLDESGQIITPESHQRYTKILRNNPIINPGGPSMTPADENKLVVSSVLSPRNNPDLKIIRKMIRKS